MPDNGNGIQIDIGPLHAKRLPKWCGGAVVLVVLVIALAYTWSQYGDEIYNPISKLEAAQLTEAQVHFWDDPSEEYEIKGGVGVVRVYGEHDDCTATLWHLANGTTDTSWAFHPKRKLEILAGPHPLNSMQAAGFGCPGPGPGCCWDPHSPPMQEKPQPLNGCVTRVWRYFPHGQDSCIHYQDADNCARRWISPVIWTRCLH